METVIVLVEEEEETTTVVAVVVYTGPCLELVFVCQMLGLHAVKQSAIIQTDSKRRRDTWR